MKYNVKRKNARTICQERGINYGTWVYRVYTLGMDKEEAIKKPVRTAEVVKNRKSWVRYYKKLGMNTKEIAHEVGITPVRVCQILRGL